MIGPEDPRHGTYAGYEAHKKSKIPQCEPCAEAGYKTRKRMRMAGPVWTVLGDDAHRVVVTVPPSALARTTGLSRRTLHRLKVEGPAARVRHETRTKLLRSNTVTPIGVTRRLRALAAIGWSARQVAMQAGVARWNLEYARNSDDRKYAHEDFAAKVVAAYEAISMTPAPAGRAATRQRRMAEERGWAPPLAWDCVDTDDKPSGVGHKPRSLSDKYTTTEFDATVVDRVLSGDWHLDATPAERAAVVTRWTAGGGSLNELERHTGWNCRRYVKDAA